MNALWLFLATFVVVFLLGLQQLHVEGRHAAAAFVTSIGITGANLVLFKLLPGPTDWVQIAAHMLGGAFGIVTSMWAHPFIGRLMPRPKRHRQAFKMIRVDGRTVRVPLQPQRAPAPETDSIGRAPL